MLEVSDLKDQSARDVQEKGAGKNRFTAAQPRFAAFLPQRVCRPAESSEDRG